MWRIGETLGAQMPLPAPAPCRPLPASGSGPGSASRCGSSRPPPPGCGTAARARRPRLLRRSRSRTCARSAPWKCRGAWRRPRRDSREWRNPAFTPRRAASASISASSASDSQLKLWMPLRQRVLHLLGGLADPGKHHLGGVAARLHHPVQLAAGDDVEARPGARQQRQHARATSWLSPRSRPSAARRRRPRRRRGSSPGSSGRIDVGRRAHARGQVGQRNLLAVEVLLGIGKHCGKTKFQYGTPGCTDCDLPVAVLLFRVFSAAERSRFQSSLSLLPGERQAQVAEELQNVLPHPGIDRRRRRGPPASRQASHRYRRPGGIRWARVGSPVSKFRLAS